MLGKVLRILRDKYELTQEEIAEKLGIPRSTYSNYESGKREPDNAMLEKIADHYEVDTDFLFGRKPKEPTKLNPLNKRLLDGFEQLSIEDKEYLVGLIERMPKKLN